MLFLAERAQILERHDGDGDSDADCSYFRKRAIKLNPKRKNEANFTSKQGYFLCNEMNESCTQKSKGHLLHPAAFHGAVAGVSSMTLNIISWSLHWEGKPYENGA